jgi:hypothetical protein
MDSLSAYIASTKFEFNVNELNQARMLTFLEYIIDGSSEDDWRISKSGANSRDTLRAILEVCIYIILNDVDGLLLWARVALLEIVEARLVNVSYLASRGIDVSFLSGIVPDVLGGLKRLTSSAGESGTSQDFTPDKIYRSIR